MTGLRASVAMATYNGARYLPEQLDSFVSQTYLPAELVVTDDGSTDDSLAIVEAFAKSAPFRVRIERNPSRLGYTRNFERAVSLCEGDIIFISDQDDAWFPEKIGAAMSVFEADPSAQVVVNDQILTGEAFKGRKVTIFGNARKLGIPDSTLIAGSCTALRRTFLEPLLPFPESIPYDNWVGLMAWRLGLKRLIEQPLQIFRRHQTNSSQPVVAVPNATMWTLIRRFGLDDPRRAWEREIEILGEYAARIIERRATLTKTAGRDAVEKALADIDGEREWLRRRLRLLSVKRLRRLRHVAAFWRNGFYDSQMGIKSAIKDAIRP